MIVNPHPDTATAQVCRCEPLALRATISEQGWIALERDGGQSHLLVRSDEWPAFAKLIHDLNTLLHPIEEKRACSFAKSILCPHWWKSG